MSADKTIAPDNLNYEQQEQAVDQPQVLLQTPRSAPRMPFGKLPSQQSGDAAIIGNGLVTSFLPRAAPMSLPGVPSMPFGMFQFPQQRGQPMPSAMMFAQHPGLGIDPRMGMAMGQQMPGGWPSATRFMPPTFPSGYPQSLPQNLGGAPAHMAGDTSSRKRTSAASLSTEVGNDGDSDTSRQGSPHKDEVSAPKKVKKARRPESDEGNLNGEQRLMIVFDSFGRLTSHPQKMGRKQGFIPDGVSGTFSMYGESWGFEVKHEQVVKCDDGEERVCIRWTVTNKVSGVTHSVVETPSDATKRDIRGVSLCNKVFVQAMELRAREYEVLVEKEKNSESPNMLKVSNYRSRAQCLRPQRFSEGPLLFGLRHKCVQENMSMQ